MASKENEYINKEQKAAADSKQKEEDFGYSLYPERGSSKFKQGSIGESLFTFKHKCQIMLQFAMDTSKGTAAVCTHVSMIEILKWEFLDFILQKYAIMFL